MKIFDMLMPLIGSGLLLVLAGAMVRRSLHREYPFFFSYIVFTFLRAIILLPVSGNAYIYFYSYWITEIFSALLAIFGLHDAFYDVFSGFYAFWWFKLIFPAVVVVISFLSVGHAARHPIPKMPMFMHLIFAFDSAVAYVKAGVFIIFILLVVFLRVRWRRYPYDIALGFAINSVGMLTSYAVFPKGAGYWLVARYAQALSYIVATIVWLWSFAGKFEPQPQVKWGQGLTPEQVRDQINESVETMKKGIAKRDDN
ncbi:MAG TPA: hypothetical protein VJV96_11370 [Candidatus Angelobacter sp.]|jgi:hypothetical protein|nr:hypothetical protein [Candidatus Angelobacter sp.]